MADGVSPNATKTGERLHLQHGPIDLIVQAWGTPDAIAAAYHATRIRFATILEKLVAELSALRAQCTPDTFVQGTTARRMVQATKPFAKEHFITPMAAVAGAVADEILSCMTSAAPLTKAYVNNGGDIAVHVLADEVLRVGLVPLPDPFSGGALVQGQASIDGGSGVGGIATSGRFGRSFSRGIADAVTVAAASAAQADAAATLIANAVNLESEKVSRQPAVMLDADSDLGDLPVTVAVADLDHHEIDNALAQGLALAEEFIIRKHITGAVLSLQGETRITGGASNLLQVHKPDTNNLPE